MRAIVLQVVGVALVAVGVGVLVGCVWGFQFGAGAALTLAGLSAVAFGLSEED